MHNIPLLQDISYLKSMFKTNNIKFIQYNMYFVKLQLLTNKNKKNISSTEK